MTSPSSRTMDSPFKDRIHTNYLPSDEEIVQIRDICARLEPEKELAHLDAEISRLQATRKQLQDDLDGHRGLAQPLRRLSPELLQLVFTYCLPNGFAVMDASQAPLSLGRICRRWRDIAYNTPHLWSSIHIVVPPPDLTPLAKLRLAGCEDWLARSGATQLDISLCKDRAVPPRASRYPEHPPVLNYVQLHSDTTVAPFIELLMKHCNRWRTFRALMPPFVPKQLSNLTAEDVPMLKSFSISDEELNLNQLFLMRDSDNWSQYYRFLDSAGQLRQVSFVFPLYKWEGDRPWIPSYEKSSLTSLCFEFRRGTMFGGSEEVAHFLSQFPHIRRCSISALIKKDADGASSNGPSRYQLNELQYLHLRLGHSNGAGSVTFTSTESILTRIVAPNLTHLDVALEETSPFQSLLNFLRVSDCSLTCLKLSLLSPSSTDSSSLLECLKLSSNLQELALHYALPELVTWMLHTQPSFTKTEEAVLRALKGSKPTLCPKLSKLMILNTMDGYQTLNQELLQTRAYSPHAEVLEPLRFITIQTVANLSADRLTDIFRGRTGKWFEWRPYAPVDATGMAICLPTTATPSKLRSSPWHGQEELRPSAAPQATGDATTLELLHGTITGQILSALPWA